MIRLIRPPTPGRFSNGDDKTVAERKEWYDDRYGADGKTWKDRWNWIDKDGDGVSAIRRSLETMSHNRCAWCEKILQKGWQVDHLLPKADFPLVGYCPDNFLPACAACNRRKDTAIPPDLIGKSVIDPVLVNDYPTATPFVKDVLYPSLSERLVDPSFDEPSPHIEFIPAALSFRGITPAGIFTVNALLNSKESATEWSKIHDFVFERMTELASKEYSQAIFDKLIDAQVEFLGQPTIINSLVKHWQELLIPTEVE